MNAASIAPNSLELVGARRARVGCDTFGPPAGTASPPHPAPGAALPSGFFDESRLGDRRAARLLAGCCWYGSGVLSRCSALGLVVLAASAIVVACSSTPAPFTRETVLAQHRDEYPALRAPADATAARLRQHEGLVYARPPSGALELDVYAPVEGGPYPAVLMVHGGGWERGDRAMERPLARHLAARGYVTATVSYRLGAPGRFPAALHDLKAAVRWLREHAPVYNVDATQLAAVGASAGGQLVALLGASNGAAALEGASSGVSSSVQAIVVIDGLADFTGVALLEKERANPGAPTRFLGGPYAERADVWRDASALTHVSPESAPTLFINSTAKTPILPGREEMCGNLRAHGVPCSVVVMQGTPHPFWLVEPWFTPTLEHVDRFLREQFGSGR